MKDAISSWIFSELTHEQWRATARVAFVIIVCIHIFWSGGYISFPGEKKSGFAYSREIEEVRVEVTNLSEDINSIQTTLLSKDIELSQQRACEAEKDGNIKAMRYSIEKRNDLILRYNNKSEYHASVPTCEELGIIPKLEGDM